MIPGWTFDLITASKRQEIFFLTLGRRTPSLAPSRQLYPESLRKGEINTEGAKTSEMPTFLLALLEGKG